MDSCTALFNGLLSLLIERSDLLMCVSVCVGGVGILGCGVK